MLPKLITIGDWFLPTYGVLVALAFLAAVWITVRLARSSGLPGDKVTDLAIYCALAGLIGAKLLMFAFDFPRYREHPEEIFSWATLQAAGVYQGGLLLAILVAFWYMRRVGLPPWKTADAFAPGIALGHAIGRLGCFSAGCCWGILCDRPWAVRFTNPDAHNLTDVPVNVPLHPTQLYESFTEFLIFLFLLWRYRQPHQPGQILALYLVLSSIGRFLIEFLRHHEQALPFGLPLSLTQWISLALFLFGVARLWQVRRPALAAA